MTALNSNLNTSNLNIDGSNRPKYLIFFIMSLYTKEFLSIFVLFFRRARTLYPCEADNPSELSFEANVIIQNIRRSKESGWLEGTYNGKSGLVPGNYVQILDE